MNIVIIGDSRPPIDKDLIFNLVSTVVSNGDTIITTDAIGSESVINYALITTPQGKKPPIIVFSLAGPDGSGTSPLQSKNAAKNAKAAKADVRYFQGPPETSSLLRLKIATDSAVEFGKNSLADETGIVVLWDSYVPHTSLPPVPQIEDAIAANDYLLLLPNNKAQINSRSLPKANTNSACWRTTSLPGVWASGLLWQSVHPQILS